MDYDDNAFQAQNLQLAGEGGSKFSSVLHPYAISKFDSVDGLRFESLVENEVFLGIPIQGDNNWIEDFSQGTSGIEFSSSAAESCSVSRHINVWSEATSSQSVEMLLKSVESSNPSDSENMSIDRKCDDSYQREAHTSAKVGESLKNVGASVGNLNEPEIPHKASDICFENVNALLEGTCKGVEEHNVTSQEANIDGQVSSKTMSVTSVEMLKETPTIDNIKDGNDPRGVHKDNPVPVIAEGPEFDTTKANCSALDVTAGPTNLASCDKNGGIPSLSGSDFAADRAIDCNKVQNTPVLNVGSHEVAEAVASESHKAASVERNQKVASQDVAVDTSNANTASFDLVGSSECDANHILEPGGNSADSAKPNCDSPSVISCTKPSNSDGDKQEAIKVVMVENVRENGNCNEDKSFTFEVGPTILVGSPSISGGGQMEAKRVKEISVGPHQGSDVMILDGGDKVTPTRKPRRGSQMVPTIVEDNSPQVSQGMIPQRGVKGTPARRTRLEPCQAAGQENAKKGKTNGNVKKKGIGAMPPNVISVPGSNLPDLYTSVTPSILFQQPFTDAQQVQLGAQILVYGSLIQGAAPDGACMVSAFGPSDGTRHVWEPTWHACLKRLQGTRTSHQESKRGPLQHKVVSSPVGQTSPLLGFHQALSPLPNFVGHNLSLLSQASFTGPWVASPQNSSFDPGPHYSGSHITEAIKLTPVKESSFLVSSRKRKGGLVTGDLGQISAPSSHFSTSVTVTSVACSASEGNPSKTLSPISPSSYTDRPQRGDPTVESEYKVLVWKDSASASDIEAKLASAALAISAAASVAKTAAAAAKIASNAALQAKLMVDEAFFQSENGTSTQNDSITLPGVTSSNILKGGDGSNCSSSIIIAAREASRRKVEAAKAASKHAENLDAIVKAAELTEEAVSQARKILGELVESVPQVQFMQDFISNNVNRGLSDSNTAEQVPCPAKQPKVGPSSTEMHTMNHDGVSPLPREISRVLKDDLTMAVDNNSSAVRSSDEAENATGLSKQNSITKGCFVEVLQDGGNCEAAWFSANVLSLADGRALVSYTHLRSDEGSEQLEEFVPLENDGKKPPKIRVAHPITTIPSEGTRKRRRDAMTDYYSWAVGDRVDAWMQNCWCEGIVAEKKNETTFTVHFPAKGETLVVRAWDLRPTLLWKDGEWIERPRSKGGSSSQGDSPQEKRLKSGSPVIQRKMNDKDLKDINLGEVEKHDESRLLPSLADEKMLDVGNNNKAIENNLDGHRRKRTGLQKGVNIGVPKPGKNTKFMEVNKHYISQRSDINNQANDSVKFAKYLMPLESRDWKNSSSVNANDKRAAESEHNALNLGKLPKKDRVRSSAKAASSDAKLMELGFCCDTEDGVVGPTIFSSQALMDGSSEEIQSSNPKSERVKKGKYEEEAGGKSANVGLRANLSTDVVEPRRSNRTIQPTSRLLEGLQSSLIASKIPPLSTDKTQRSQNRPTTPKGNNNHG